MYWGAFVYENEIHDLFGITVEGDQCRFKGRFHRTTVKHPFTVTITKGETPMSKQITVPFGPQHPVLPEPIHLDLVLRRRAGGGRHPLDRYIHRGFEKLVEKREFTEIRLCRGTHLRDLQFHPQHHLCGGHRADHEGRSARACAVPQNDLVGVFEAALPPPLAGSLCRRLGL